MPLPVETIIGDEVFPSRTAAGNAKGVSSSAVCIAAKQGRLEQIGKRKQRKTEPFYVRGILYKTYSECARKHDCSMATVRRAVLRGRQDLDIPPRGVKSFYLDSLKKSKQI